MSKIDLNLVSGTVGRVETAPNNHASTHVWFNAVTKELNYTIEHDGVVYAGVHCVEPTHHVKFTKEEVIHKEHIENAFIKLPKQECNRELCALWNGEYTYANGSKIKRGEFCARCKRDRWQQSGDRPDLFRSV